MKILSMTATFGKLDHETLTLRDGLNILTAPNEWGKSTWCAFMVAMLYGIDTRQQTTKTNLAAKERYAPWNGAPMSGRMDILWEGRAITLERSGKPRAPFSIFRAYETHSGTAVAELTATNCGQALLGVEKEVFLRSAFLRLSDLPLTDSEALRSRLNALVTTGDESGAGMQLDQKLNKLKNEIFANRSKGLLPQTRAQLEHVNAQLQQLEALNTHHADLLRQQQVLQQMRAELEARYNAREQHQEALLAAQNALQQLPPPPAMPASPIPNCPDPAALLAQVRQERLSLEKSLEKKDTPLWLSILLLLAAAVALFFIHPVAPLAILLYLPFFLHTRSKRKQVQQTLERLRTFPEEVIQQYLENRSHIMDAQKDWHARHGALFQKVAELQQTLPASVSQELSQCESDLRSLQLQLGSCQGQLVLLEQKDSLLSQRDALMRRCNELETTYRAVLLARQTLAQATAQLQNRFAPRINKRAQALFSRLTGGRYDRLTLTDNLCVETAAETENILRSPLWRSDGTADQLYLAVRLAVSAELLPSAPFILDDALVRFDDARLHEAMMLLQEEAQSRQILLFTCQGREQAVLSEGDVQWKA